MADRTLTVSAPASSANLGPGFDCLAMALDLRNELTVTGNGTGRITVTGEGADSVPTTRDNLIAATFARIAPDAIDEVDLRCVNRVPLARGLGSSTAAAACAVVAAWEWTDTAWTADMLCAELAAIDGHDDNAAACAHGGIVGTHRPADGGGDLAVFSLGPASWLSPVVVVPSRELSTAASRTALPDSYSRGRAVHQVAATAALVTAIGSGDASLAARALRDDLLHERYRAHLVPELAEIRSALPDGALGATLSGAGPTVLVWVDARVATADQVATELSERFAPACTVQPLPQTKHGACRS